MSPSTKLIMSLASFRFWRRRHHNHDPMAKRATMPNPAATAMPTLAPEVMPGFGDCGREDAFAMAEADQKGRRACSLLHDAGMMERRGARAGTPVCLARQGRRPLGLFGGRTEGARTVGLVGPVAHQPGAARTVAVGLRAPKERTKATILVRPHPTSILFLSNNINYTICITHFARRYSAGMADQLPIAALNLTAQPVPILQNGPVLFLPAEIRLKIWE